MEKSRYMLEQKRTSAMQLPTYNELLEILKKESVRTLSVEKEKTTYVNFDTILALLNYFKLSTKFFESIKFEDLQNIETYNEVLKMFNDLAVKILENQDDAECRVLLNNLYEYLAQTDEPAKADIIFVFGSKATVRTETAIRLFSEGYAPKIVIAGQGPFYEIEQGNKSEAELLGDFAISKGIPKESLILETTSITVPDNVKASLNLLEKLNIPHKRVILVNSPFVQRRGFAHFNKLSDTGTEILRVNTDTVSDKFSKDGWYKNEEGIKTILKEFYGLRISNLVNTG
jgi:hypothetical protein